MTEYHIDWYSHPTVSQSTGGIFCQCNDSHHLLTNLRVRTSTKCVQGVSSNAWKRVAKSHKTGLTPAMEKYFVDKQSNSFAQTHFSEECDNKLKQNGDRNEAYFCRLIRGCYEAGTWRL